MVKNYRKRRALAEEDDGGDEATTRVSASVEEIRLIQKQRERTKGVAAGLLAVADAPKEQQPVADGAAGETEGNEELVLQDTFAQETAITVEDPNMIKYVEQELAKRRGQELDAGDDQEKKLAEEDALYAIPEHLQVKKKETDEGSTAWTTGIAEVQLPIDYKLKNIEETEKAKRMLQERRPFFGRGRGTTTTLPASYSADFYQRGREYAEKMRQENPDYRGRGGGQGGGGMGRGMGGGQGAGEGSFQHHGGEPRRQTATDDIMLERFRKRERTRMMRR